MQQKEKRIPELEQYKSIWLTREGYKILRKQRIDQKLSMAKIVDNLIIQEYGTIGISIPKQTE